MAAAEAGDGIFLRQLAVGAVRGFLQLGPFQLNIEDGLALGGTFDGDFHNTLPPCRAGSVSAQARQPEWNDESGRARSGGRMLRPRNDTRAGVCSPRPPPLASARLPPTSWTRAPQRGPAPPAR